MRLFPHSSGNFLRSLAVAVTLILVGTACPNNPGIIGGGGGGPTALTVTNVSPLSGGTTAPLNTFLFIKFNKAVNAASAVSHISLVNTDAATPTTVTLTQNTSLDSIGDGSLIVMDPMGDLVQDTNYEITIAAGVTAMDGGLLAASVTSAFTSGPTGDLPVSVSYPAPSSITINGVQAFPGGLIYVTEPNFDLAAALSTDRIILAVINLVDGMSMPGDLLPLSLSGTILPAMTIDITGAPMTTPDTGQSYTGTLTFYDLALNSNNGGDTFTVIFDNVAPPVPNPPTRTDMMSGPVSAASIDVDVTYASSADVATVRVMGGLNSPVDVAAGSMTATNMINVPLRLNQTNNLTAATIDLAGNISAVSSPALQIVHDDTAPGLTGKSFIPALTKSTDMCGGSVVNRIAVDTLKFSATVTGGESAVVNLCDHLGDPTCATPLNTVTSSGFFNLNQVPQSGTLPANTTSCIKIQVADADQPSNMAILDYYEIYVDTEVNPAPVVTAASAGGMSCDSMGNPVCVSYQPSPSPGYRVGVSQISISGTVEFGSTLQLRPTSALFTSTTSDPSSDVFPASGGTDPVLKLQANILTTLDIDVTDSVGNMDTFPNVSVTDQAEFIYDTLPPEPPIPTGASTSGATCTVGFSASDPRADAVVALAGPFTGDCDALVLNLDLLDDAANADPTKGEMVSALINAAGFTQTTPVAPATPPATVSEMAAVTLPADYQDGIKSITVTAVDAVSNGSAEIDVVVIHRTNGDELIVPQIEELTNVDGSRAGLSLDTTCNEAVAPDIEVCPSNATMITVEGRTSPSATATIDVLDGPKSMPGATLQSGIAVDASTGYFTFTLGSFTADTTNYFTIRANDPSGSPTMQDVELRIVNDQTSPTTPPDVTTVTSPQGSGATGAVAVIVADFGDLSGLDQTEVVARRYSDAACSMPLTTSNTCSSSGAPVADESCAPLDSGSSTTLYIEAASGDYIGISYRDLAGNETANAFPPRACKLVPAGLIVAAAVTGTQPGLNFFDLNEPMPAGAAVTLPGNAEATGFHFYTNDRLLILNQNIGSGMTNIYNYQISTNTFEAGSITLPSIMYAGLTTSFDRERVAVLFVDAINPVDMVIHMGAMDASQQLPAALDTQMAFPGPNASGTFPVSMALFPAVGPDPQGDWIAVLRNPIFGSPPPDGDLVIFDLDTAVSPSAGPVVPAAFTLPTTRGLPAGPLPLDLEIRPDGRYALAANASTGVGLETLEDITLFDFSACTAATPGSCTLGDFTSLSLAIKNASGVDINGLQAIHFYPGDPTRAIAVEASATSPVAAAIHLLQINWLAGTVTTEFSLNMNESLASILTVLSNGSEALVMNNNKTLIYRIDINIGTGMLVPHAGTPTMAPAPAGNAFRAAIEAQP